MRFCIMSILALALVMSWASLDFWRIWLCQLPRCHETVINQQNIRTFDIDESCVN